MICQNCGTENRANAKFCNECGINLLNNNSKNKVQEGNKNTVMWIIMAFVLIIGFFFREYLFSVIAAGVVAIAFKK